MVAVCVGIPGQIEPRRSQSFAKRGRPDQSVDQSLDRIGTLTGPRLGEKVVQLFTAERQSGQRQRESSRDRMGLGVVPQKLGRIPRATPAWSGRHGRRAMFFQPQPVERRTGPSVVASGWNRGPARRPIRPVRSPCQVVIGTYRAGWRRTTDRRRSARRRSGERLCGGRLCGGRLRGGRLGCWGLGCGGRGRDHVPGLPTEEDGRRTRAQPNGQQDECEKSRPIERDANEADGVPPGDGPWEKFHRRRRLNVAAVMVAATNHANGSRVASSSSIPPEARQSGEIVSRTGSRDGRSGRSGNSRNADKSTQGRRIRM